MSAEGEAQKGNPQRTQTRSLASGHVRIQGASAHSAGPDYCSMRCVFAGFWVIGLLGCCVVGLLGCWVVGLLVCLLAGLIKPKINKKLTENHPKTFQNDVQNQSFLIF